MNKKKSFWSLAFIPILEFIILFISIFVIETLIVQFVFAMVPDLSGALFEFFAYGLTIVTWAVIVIYCLIVKPDRPVLQSIGTKVKGNNIKMALMGLLLGLGSNALCIFIAILHKDIFLYFNKELGLRSVGIFFALFFVTFMQSSSEELLCRGFMYQRFRACCKYPAVAILVPSILFAMMHLNNPGMNALAFINIMLFGIFNALVVHYLDSIWMAFMLHTGWNFSQAFLFGLPNSGNVAHFSIFKIDAAVAKNSFAYHVVFGIEATIVTSILLSIACIALLIYGIKFKKQPTPIRDAA